MSVVAPPGSSQVPDVSLSDYVLAASRVLVGLAARSLADNEEITVPQFRVLVLLAQRGSLRAADIATGLATSPSQATRLCDRLVRKQLVSRASVPGDRRGVLVQLTNAGRELIDEVMARRRLDIEALIATIPEELHETLYQAFAAFIRAAGEVPDSTSVRYWEL